METFKRIPFLMISLAMLILLLPACKSSQQASASKSEFIPLSLEDLLRREGGLSVSGSGTDLIIRIRGNSSIQGDNEPLFVVDGTPVLGYSSIANTIDPLSVADIQIISGARAGIYGARGSNGVIAIKLKTE